MGNRAALVAYVGLCIVLAGVALYAGTTITIAAPPRRPAYDPDAFARQIREIEHQRRLAFREDVADAVRTALIEWSGKPQAAPADEGGVSNPIEKAPY